MQCKLLFVIKIIIFILVQSTLENSIPKSERYFRNKEFTKTLVDHTSLNSLSNRESYDNINYQTVNNIYGDYLPPPTKYLPYLNVTISLPYPLLHTGKPNGFQDKESTTPTGINCRRIMNSELNELGEIVDSVREICDPPPTTTTTTRRPIVITTPRKTTITSKPLVKVCRPHMDSYLNEKGEIIDSVVIVCKMEELK